MKKAIVLLAALPALGGLANAGVTDAQVAEIMTSKGFALEDTDVSADRMIRATIWSKGSSLYGVTIVDVDNDGDAELLQFFSAVYAPSATPGADFFMDWNASGWFTASNLDGTPVLHDTDVQIGGASVANVTANFEFFVARFGEFDWAIRGSADASNVSVSMDVKSDPYRLDRGMTRVEVKARDAALARALNMTRGSVDSIRDERVQEMASVAKRLSKKLRLPR
ncbi:hypothetical protein HK107_06240 [Parvularcula sp. ZS-1/3]|uniref:Uncharacterized protein n=1 Tax=Parvularcula mediterranea TaxID=2732508 RepID=A0A7Y3W562_9PROT|nr:hypothetical protein [Parvularcula mediterranea]NNU15921.1 hypothetical protein [Parvularcula mediterranea]